MDQMSAEARVEETLLALGRMQPSPGFEKRLLGELQRRAVHQNSVGQGTWWSRIARLQLAVGAASLLLVFLTFAVVAHRRAHTTVPEAVNRQGASPAFKVPETAAPRRDIPGAEPAAVPHEPLTPGASGVAHVTVSRIPAARLLLKQGTSVSGELVAEAVADTRVSDLQAMEDLRAPSHPAPPLPPTAQERLVRLMLRRGEKHDLAQLDSAQTNASFATEQAAFQVFFEPNPPPPADSGSPDVNPSTQPHGDPQ